MVLPRGGGFPEGYAQHNGGRGDRLTPCFGTQVERIEREKRHRDRLRTAGTRSPRPVVILANAGDAQTHRRASEIRPTDGRGSYAD